MAGTDCWPQPWELLCVSCDAQEKHSVSHLLNLSFFILNVDKEILTCKPDLNICQYKKECVFCNNP